MSATFDVADHYERAHSVYRELGRLDGALATGNADKTKWYVTDQVAAGEWDGRARPVALSADADALDIDRVVYASINYTPADYYMDAWRRYSWVDPDDPDDTPTREWESGENPMPDYGDLSALAPFADVDLRGDVKAERPDGEAPQDTVAAALDGYIQGFADLCGGRGPVHALDSVGGAYVMVAPGVSAPIADQFGGNDRAAIFEELCSRVNDHLSDVRDNVSERVEGHDDVLDPDFVTHKNRVYKAPLSLHDDLDGVVTPIATDAPAYDYTPVGAVTDAVVEDAEAWAESFTADYSGRVGQLVAALWGGAPEVWTDTLEAWLEKQRAEEQASGDAEPADGDDGGDDPPVEGQRTAPLSDVYQALDNLDAERVAEKTIVHSWNDSHTSGDGVRAFYPTWGPNCNGTGNIIGEKGVWKDHGEGDKGTVVEMALIASNDVNWTRGEIATGSDWVRGIRELRRLDFDVPLPSGDVEDMSRYYALDLSGIAADHGVDGDPYEDDHALLQACLYAREETPDVADEKPPYDALVAVAEHVGLDMDDSDEKILGKTTYKVARRVFDDLEPGDL